jgi:tetratricopeptide (TPR) repeat protein
MSRTIHNSLFLALALAATACGPREGQAPAAPSYDEAAPPRFIGRQACEGCHETATANWRGSHHDRAMEQATDATVLGDFGGATFTHFGVTSTFSKKDGKFFARTDGPDGKLHDYEIAYTFGIDPLQQYLIRFPDGRLQALNVCWDTRPKENGGQRWFHLYPKEAIPFDDVLHWTGIYQNWNFMCSECHSTDVKKRYDAVKRAYDTTWFEMDVSCEACHGPGSNHDAWAHARRAKSSTANYADLGLAVRLREPEPATWVMDPKTGIAKRDRPRISRTEIETCGRCHARRAVVAAEYAYGRPLMDSHRVALLTPGLYHADGQILDEDYEYGSFLQSKMYAAGVTCTDCHEPHAAKPLPGNGACVKCHLPATFDAVEHHHHKMDGRGAACGACHMPTTNYMVVHARHDHGFKVPRPDLTGSIGTPNACSNCHADKPLSWSIAAYRKWWGDKRTREPHWSLTIAAGRADPVAAAPALAALIADPAQPAIVRATAADLAEASLQQALPSLIDALSDPDPLVRDAAIQALSESDPRIRAKVLPPLTEDPVRTVRIDAGRALAGAAAASLPPPERRRAADALAEWRASQNVDADRPEARLNLCALDAELGDLANAEVECHEALRLAPKIPGPYVNLADVQRAEEREDAARATLRLGLKVAPDSAAIWHALGLALVRDHRPVEALEALKKAAELEPNNRRFVQVYEMARKEYH